MVHYLVRSCFEDIYTHIFNNQEGWLSEVCYELEIYAHRRSSLGRVAQLGWSYSWITLYKSSTVGRYFRIRYIPCTCNLIIYRVATFKPPFVGVFPIRVFPSVTISLMLNLFFFLNCMKFSIGKVVVFIT